MKLRDVVKKAIRFIVALLVLPLFLLYWLLSSLFVRDEVFSAFSQFLSPIPGKIGTYCRSAFYAMACARTSQDMSVGFLTLLSHADTTIEQGVYIGPQGNIGMCKIGKNTLLGSGVHVLSGSRQHRFSDPDTPIKEQGGEFIKIGIGEDCWIGNGAIIMADIGNKCVVAAGSIVTKPVAENSIVAGNPAKVISNRQT